jgi:nifR3 family TIM-barrel protein
MRNFWQKLLVPFSVLAPMEGVTDVVFREIITKVGKPDVFFTEFTSCDGISSKGKEEVAKKLLFRKNQQPIVAQIFGTKPETFFSTAKFVKKLGFSGVDINMGCPDKTILKQGSCAALIQNPSLAKEIIQATKKGAKDLPVSVKTRIGFSHFSIDWIRFLLQQDLEAVTVHLRTVKEQSLVDAHWDLLPQIVTLRNSLALQTRIIGNGDVSSLSEVEKKCKQYGCEGVMIGRGIFKNPWLFNKTIHEGNISLQDRINLYEKHIKLFQKTWGNKKNPSLIKKFCKMYINNFPKAREVRENMMKTKTLLELLSIIQRLQY